MSGGTPTLGALAYGALTTARKMRDEGGVGLGSPIRMLIRREAMGALDEGDLAVLRMANIEVVVSILPPSGQCVFVCEEIITRMTDEFLRAPLDFRWSDTYAHGAHWSGSHSHWPVL